MRRQSALRNLLVATVFGAFVPLAVGVFVRLEPASFPTIQPPPVEKRQELSSEFTKRFHRLWDAVANSEESWSETFTADQINSYLAEEFTRVRPFQIPKNIHSLRVAIEPDRLRFAFRYGQGLLSAVVTVDLKIWLVAQEVNLLAIEILDLRAGVLPVSVHAVFEWLADHASAWNMEVTWYRHGNNPVALVRLQPDQPNPSLVLEQLELQDRKVRIAGKSNAPLAWSRVLSFQRAASGSDGE